MKFKNLIISGLGFFLIFPFILVSDIYPFFRFGMFAEPIHQTVQTERFVICYYDLESKLKILPFETTGFEESHLLYILRSYYYRGNLEQFFSQIHQISKKSLQINRWALLRIETKPAGSQIDTTKVFEWSVDE
jgi:hypothetical protein